MKFVFIYGPPAAGKSTVARELARITSFAVFDDHLSINSLFDVFGSRPESMDRLVEHARLSVIEEAAREGVDLIFAFVYVHPEDLPYVDRIYAAVEAHGGAVCPVQLTCSTAAQEHRVEHPERAPSKKVNSVAIVRDWNARYDLLTPIPGRESLSMDTTNMSPAEAAERIARHYGLAANGK